MKKDIRSSDEGMCYYYYTFRTGSPEIQPTEERPQRVDDGEGIRQHCELRQCVVNNPTALWPCQFTHRGFVRLKRVVAKWYFRFQL